VKAGILALQGDFHAHGAALDRLDLEWIEVVKGGQIDEIDGLIIPGGESTTLLKLLNLDTSLKDKITELARSGGAIYGTCAGAILLAKTVSNPVQECLSILDINIIRNGYGRQNESFVIHPGDDGVEGDRVPQELVFIRAPLIKETGPQVKVLAVVNGAPVYVEENNIMATTFHPELSDDLTVHRHFLAKMLNGQSN